MGKPWTNNPNATNTEAVITIPASPGCAIEVEQISFSYDGTPSASRLLTFESPSGTVLQQWWVTNGGPGPLELGKSGVKGAVGQDVVVRLPADASLKGIVNAIQRVGS
jgi:hypothetical protein